MHKDWCGKPCSECKNPCTLDESMPCSPDCECLGKNGETDREECKECDALKCPLGGDETDDCSDCAYASDYHFINGECVRRNKQ